LNKTLYDSYLFFLL